MRKLLSVAAALLVSTSAFAQQVAIQNLPKLSSVLGTDYIVDDRAGVTSIVTAENFFNFIESSAPGPANAVTCGADNTGVAESSAALNTCLAANAAVVIPPGTYNICAGTVTSSQYYGEIWMQGAHLQACSGFPANQYVLNIAGGNERVHFPTVDGANVANGIELTGGGIRIFTPDVTHFTQKGLAFVGGADNFAYDPKIQQWLNSDTQWQTDGNFTADAIYVNQSDSYVIGGVSRWSGVNFYADASAGTFWVIDHHMYNGRTPNEPTYGARTDPVNVHIAAGASGIFFDGDYFDNGHIDLYSYSVSFRDSFLLQIPGHAIFTDNNYIRVYANGQTAPYQLSLGFVGVDLGSTNPIAYLPNSPYSWTGDWGGLASVISSTGMQDLHGSSGEVFIQHHADSSVPARSEYKPNGTLDHYFQIGTATGSNLSFTNTQGTYDQFWNVGQGLNLTTATGAPISAPYWGLNGLAISGQPRTLNDSSSSGTVGEEAASVIPFYTITATSPVTFNRFDALYLWKPSAGTNVTIVNPWSLRTQGGIDSEDILEGENGLSVIGNGITAGAPTDGNMGVGNVNVSGGYYVNGVEVTGGGGSTTLDAFSVLANPTNSTTAGVSTPLGNNLGFCGGSLCGVQALQAKTGSTYAIASGDAGNLLTFANAANVAVSLPSASTTGFTAGFAVDWTNLGPATVCFTPATSTINGAARLCAGAFSSGTITSDGANYQMSSTSQARLDLRYFGAKGDGSTNDAPPLSAAIGVVNTLSAAGISACIYAPATANNYYINGAVAAFAAKVPGCVTGDGQYLTSFNLGPSFSSASGYLFAQSEAWSTTNATNNFNYGVSLIGSRYQGFMITGNTTQSGQGGIAFLDRNDMVTVRDVTCQYITLSCISIGTLLADSAGQAYMRESEFYNVKAWHSGSTTVPAIEIGSTTNGTASDATNELKWYGLNIFAAAGPSLVLDTNYVAGASPKGTDDLMFYGTRIEQNSNSSASDMIRIGGTVNTGSVYNVQFHGLEFIGMLSGSTGFHVAGTSITGSGQGDNGIIADGVIYVNGAGVGVQLDQGKEISVTAQFPASLSTTLVVGSAVTCCVYVKQTGNAALSVTNSAGAGILFQEGSYATNAYAVDESGDVYSPSFQSTGTKFTVAGSGGGCGTIGAKTGGATAGKFVAGAVTSCQVTVTFGGGYSFQNDTSCFASDTTTPADLPTSIASTASTLTVNYGTIVSGDTLKWGCIGY